MVEADVDLPETIKGLVKKYISKYDKQPLTGGKILKCESAYDINNGLCDNFAEELISLLGGENEQQFILSSDMFLSDFYDEAVGIWGKKNIVKTKNGCAWSKKMLSLYSIPIVEDIKLVEYLPSHVWVCINFKHYDSENPKGSNTPWELLIFKKCLEKNILNFPVGD